MDSPIFASNYLKLRFRSRVQMIVFRQGMRFREGSGRQYSPKATARPMTNDRPLRRFRGHPVVPTLPRVARKKLITINRRGAAIAVFRVSPALRPLCRAECLVHPRERVGAKFITLRRPRHD